MAGKLKPLLVLMLAFLAVEAQGVNTLAIDSGVDVSDINSYAKFLYLPSGKTLTKSELLQKRFVDWRYLRKPNFEHSDSTSSLISMESDVELRCSNASSVFSKTSNAS